MHEWHWHEIGHWHRGQLILERRAESDNAGPERPSQFHQQSLADLRLGESIRSVQRQATMMDSPVSIRMEGLEGGGDTVAVLLKYY